MKSVVLLISQDSQVDIVYMGFTKAFDSVPHDIIIKLQMYGFGGNLIKLSQSYLSGRYQRVIIDGCNSEWFPLTSGILILRVCVYRNAKRYHSISILIELSIVGYITNMY